MPILPFIILGVGLLVIFIIFVLAAGGVFAPGDAGVIMLVVMMVTGLAFLFTLSKSQNSSCNQITISTKNGITCSASKDKGK